MTQTTVNAGEIANGVVLNSGDTQYVYGTANNTIVNAGGVQNLSGSAFNTVINNGGFVTVALSAGASDDSTTINPGGVMYITGGTPTNIHFIAGGSIWLPQVDTSYPPYLQFDQQSDILTVHTSNQPTATLLHLTGDYSQSYFTFGTYTNGPANAPSTIRIMETSLCFCSGVQIATIMGERRVEQLCVGDEVLTAAGQVRPIRWIGSQSAVISPSNRPVIVRKGAFADDRPSRDVRVTRGHCFLFRDVLIPIEHLINGDTILWDARSRTMELFHIELDRHDVLIADNAFAESFRDVGNRSGFTSPARTARAAGSMPTCAPVVCRGPIVERTKRWLQERAARLSACEPSRAAA